MIWIYHTTGFHFVQVKNTFIEVSSDSDVSDVEQEFKGGLLVATFIFLKFNMHLQLAPDM